MDILSILAYCALAYFLVWFFRLFFRQRGLPHGPLPYPLFGNIPSFYKDTHLKLDQMAKQYGAIFTLWFGRTPVIIVNDASVAEEVFLNNGSKFSDRPDLINKLLTKRLCRLPYMNYCPKFTRSQLLCRNACLVHPKFLDQCISNGFNNLKTLLESKSLKKGFNPTTYLNDTIMDLLSNLIYGAPIEGATFMEFNLSGNTDVFSIANTTNQFRWMRLFRLKKYLKFKEHVSKRERILKGLFEKQRSDTHQDDTIMNAILKQLVDENKVDEKAPVGAEKPYDEAEILCSDLFFVSVEKIPAALNWMFLYFITWPEIQQRVFEEIQNNRKGRKGKDSNQYITVDEAAKMPYLRAAVYETLRLSAMTPLSTFHQTNDMVTLRGHKLPKGTWVCINLNAIHHSAKYWDNPYQFNPARFLESNGKKLRDIETIRGFFPFGAGLRKCLGDELSLNLLTTMMANVVMNYYFEISPWHLKPSLSGSSRIILVPHQYYITMTTRS